MMSISAKITALASAMGGYLKTTVLPRLPPTQAGSNRFLGVVGGVFTWLADIALNNGAVSGLKTATFNGLVTNAATSGAITINWTAGNMQTQAEPTGSITYTFTAPPGPCHLELRINSDGTSTPQTITWPASVKWIGGAAWVGVANKIGVINFSYDGTNYLAQGVNQV